MWDTTSMDHLCTPEQHMDGACIVASKAAFRQPSCSKAHCISRLMGQRPPGPAAAMLHAMPRGIWTIKPQGGSPGLPAVAIRVPCSS